jgi:hypothetical protein
MLAQVFNPTEIKKNGPATRPANTPARRNGFAFIGASVVLAATCQSYGDARGIVKGDHHRGRQVREFTATGSNAELSLRVCPIPSRTPEPWRFRAAHRAG